MVTFRLEFSESDMIEFFKRNEINVIDVTYTHQVPVYHNRFEDETLTTKCVVNPHNNSTIPVSIAFEKIIYHIKHALLLDGINKLTVLSVLQDVNGHIINENDGREPNN